MIKLLALALLLSACGGAPTPGLHRDEKTGACYIHPAQTTCDGVVTKCADGSLGQTCSLVYIDGFRETLCTQEPRGVRRTVSCS
jgi:hypothetical protein